MFAMSGLELPAHYGLQSDIARGPKIAKGQRL